ncbi:biliverdin-producing heme oxygenase [Aquibium microcysteis]|uniref:biliverdin-producing heme oxygenase n=1 Tax=Aquibium microcysteis TaxID=675281 RepID=UPI00165CEEC0|nr:biliverdin-producing heme oxygenase [Aquibium microcysteis]
MTTDTKTWAGAGDQGTARARLLRAATGQSHSRLDQAITDKQPFRNVERYGRLLLMQHAFHRSIEPLYDDARLNVLLPGLRERRRLPMILLDMADLRVRQPDGGQYPAVANAAPADVATALGWLYVAEGSNLGAAVLLKEAAKLGLSERFGARHLADTADGRGRHWRIFTTALDAVHLTDGEEALVIAGAQAAFERVHGLVMDMFA